MKPIRIQRKRTQGYDMQADSRTNNGLDCVYVGRPTKYGNPFRVGDYIQLFKYGYAIAFAPHDGYELCKDNAMAVDLFRRMIDRKGTFWRFLSSEEIRNELRGKNLSCWCSPSEVHCHADVLLSIANKEDAT